ncbi:MAG: energy-dependent translational throttle protein EttA, partial [Planctomycetota bacterium]
IMNFAGGVVVTSHDRWFLDRLATHILAFEGDGYLHWCEGNFDIYERNRKERLGVDADQPTKFRYKSIRS